MTMLHISASRDYDVLIDSAILDSSGELIAKAVSAKKALIISGDNVYPLYAPRLVQSLMAARLETHSLVLPHGEGSKSLENYELILNRLSENRFSRSDVLVALGGGVTGDLTGFAAATYQRGMAFIQIPTTLLAAVDSSVGGKTAVNLPSGKNQVGCFYQPSLVICDTDTLDTLPEAEYRCGCAEVIKYGVLGNPELFYGIRETPVKDQLVHVISTCISMKRDIVMEDEFDTGRRRLLNLGHTVGHAVEKCSGFKVLHGQAVAAGMAVATRAAVKMGVCGGDTLSELIKLLALYGLPERVEYPLEDIYAAIYSDKKMQGGAVNLILPEKIGRCRIEPVPMEELRDWLIAGGIR